MRRWCDGENTKPVRERASVVGGRGLGSATRAGVHTLVRHLLGNRVMADANVNRTTQS